MTIEDGLYAHLSADSNIVAVVSDRIYPAKLPQDPTLPALSYKRISGVTLERQNGPACVDIVRIQIDCWAKVYEDAKNLAKLVRARLEAYQGLMGSIQVQACRVLEDSMDDWDDVPDDYRVTSEFEIWYATV